MNLYFVRHGQTDLNVENKIQGHIDLYGLNATGQQQAADLTAYLRQSGLPCDAILSSPFQRAFQTAQAIQNAFDKPIEQNDGLKEISCGSYEGLNIDHVKSLVYPQPLVFKHALDGSDIMVHTGEELRRYAHSPDPAYDGIAHPDGETKRAAFDRARGAIENYVKNNPSCENLWIATHSTVIKLLLNRFAGPGHNCKVDCTDVLHFTYDQGKWDFHGCIYTPSA